MHNNGTSPLILPERRLLPDLKPQQSLEIQVTPHGILLIASVGDRRLPLTLDAQKATQLGVTLISVAALQVNAQQAATVSAETTDAA